MSLIFIKYFMNFKNRHHFYTSFLGSTTEEQWLGEDKLGYQVESVERQVSHMLKNNSNKLTNIFIFQRKYFLKCAQTIRVTGQPQIIKQARWEAHLETGGTLLGFRVKMPSGKDYYNCEQTFYTVRKIWRCNKLQMQYSYIIIFLIIPQSEYRQTNT